MPLAPRRVTGPFSPMMTARRAAAMMRPMSPRTTIITARQGEVAYDITIAPGLLGEAPERLAALSMSSRACIVTDTNVAPHARALRATLAAAGIDASLTIAPAGEAHKNLATLSTIYDELLALKIDRSTPVLAMGGGVIGDMGGFAAATLLRGLPFVQIPTTLLAMVDASVGGKTGVDHARGKNLIGAFHPPIAVLIDPQTLRTLPPRELRSGLAECIKHDAIRDAEGLAALEMNIHRALALDGEYLTSLVAHNVAIKAAIVEADPFERGERALLNFGHTFGHAIESASRFAYSHGEAVALGMCAAAHASWRLGLIDRTARQRLAALIEQAGLPTGGLELDVEQVVEAMSFDKKARAGRPRFVLLDRIGHAIVRDDVDDAVAREAIASLKG
jgi:3-dehydroquinate synthase